MAGSNVVVPMPLWKRDAPVHERLYELAEWARLHPEYFQRWILLFAEDSDQVYRVRHMTGEQTRTSDALALMTAGIQQMWEDTRKDV